MMWLGALLTGAALGGCGPARLSVPPAQEAPPPAADLKLASPEDSARTLLVYLQRDQTAVAQNDARQAAAARDQAAWHVLARDEILRRVPQRKTAKEKSELLNRIVESWSAALAYYADGLSPEQARAQMIGNDQARVLIPAAHGGEQAAVRVDVMRGADSGWHVIGMELTGLDAWNRALAVATSSQAVAVPASGSIPPATSVPASQP